MKSNFNLYKCETKEAGTTGHTYYIVAESLTDLDVHWKTQRKSTYHELTEITVVCTGSHISIAKPSGTPESPASTTA